MPLVPEADAVVRRLMRERGLSFKDAVNTAILAGAASAEGRRAETPTFALGRERLPLDRALSLAAELEDRATVVTFDNDFGRFPGVRWEVPREA